MAVFGFEEDQVLKPYKGPLSSYPEWHSFMIGIYHGVSEDKQIPTKVMQSNSDVSKEPHYAKAGFVFGVAAKYMAIGLAFKYGFVPFI